MSDTSQFAEAVCETYFNNTEGALLRNVLDTELQEAREVLDALIGEVETESSDPESELLQRARALSERLRV